MATYLDAVDYRAFVSYTGGYPDGYPNFPNGEVNPYNEAYVWDATNHTWVRDANHLTSLMMTSGYELETGDGVQYIVRTSSEGEIVFIDSSNAGKVTEGVCTATLVPTTPLNVVEPTKLMIETETLGTTVPITITLYADDDTVIATGTADSSGYTTVNISDWGLPGGDGSDSILDYNTYEWHQIHTAPNGFTHAIVWDTFDHHHPIHWTNATGSWVDTTISSTQTGAYGDSAVDVNGKVHAASTENAANPQSLLYLSNVTGSWQETTVFTYGSTNYVKYVAIAVDGNGKAHIVWYNSSTGYWKYTTNKSGSWSSEITVASSGYCKGDTSSLAVNADGSRLIFAGRKNTTWDLYAVNFNGSSWDTPTLVDTDGFGMSVIHVSSNNFELYSCYAGNLKVYKYDGSSWDGGTSITTGVALKDENLARIDSYGRRYIPVYTGSDQYTECYYSDNGVDWSTTGAFARLDANDFSVYCSGDHSGNPNVINVIRSSSDYAVTFFAHTLDTVLNFDRVEITYTDPDGDSDIIIKDLFFAEGYQQLPVSNAGASNRNIVYLDLDNDGDVDVVTVFRTPLSGDTVIKLVINGGEFYPPSSSVPADTGVLVLDPGISDGEITLKWNESTDRWEITNNPSYPSAVIVSNSGFGGGHQLTDSLNQDNPFLIPHLVVD